MADPLRPPEDHAQSGFTLIELLVSLTIMTTILGIVGSALRTLSKNWETNADRIERLEMISRAYDIFARDVSGLRRIVRRTDNGGAFVFTGSPNGLSFVTTEPAYPTNPGLYFLNYRVEANGPQADLLRERAPYTKALAKFPGATPANSVPIVQGAFKYHFSYALRTKSSAKWQEKWVKTNRIPDLIRLEIQNSQTGALIAPPFVASLRTDAELKCLSEGSDECSARSKGVLGQDEHAQGALESGEH